LRYREGAAAGFENVQRAAHALAAGRAPVLQAVAVENPNRLPAASFDSRRWQQLVNHI
jgi:acetyl-CoA acetyltransferase